MKCPRCQKRIFPFKIWLITRWTPVHCGHCGARCGRTSGGQAVVIFLLLYAGYFVLGLSPWIFVWALAVMFIDAYTVKLVLQNGAGPSDLETKT